ncbi:galactokinase, partial [Streptomyces erythrochromogenes]
GGAAGAGAVGPRMTGGGSGGTVIARAPAAGAGTVAGTVTAAFAAAGFGAPAVLEAVPSAGARRIG